MRQAEWPLPDTVKSYVLANACGILAESLQSIVEMNGQQHAEEEQGMERHKTHDEYWNSPTERFVHGTPTRLRTLLQIQIRLIEVRRQRRTTHLKVGS